ncbi:MarR family winged helix-turn-helix transcriptional regulator [Acidothermaceae bacterium B102]|nr:MarR family winged helix-turn-helix transcriptional regulator [Acidothermaceae bacterium B102]
MDTETAPRRLQRLPSWLLGQANVEARRVVSEVLAQEDLHRSGYALMATLEEFDPLSQTELADRSGHDRSDVVRLVDELEKAALVKRDRDPEDRRRNVVTITPAGRRRLVALDAALVGAQDQLTARLTPSERKQLVTLLAKLVGI